MNPTIFTKLGKMKKEDKELLLQDLCSRLPYGLVIDYNGLRTTLHDVKVFQLYDGDVIKDYNCLIDIFGDNDYVDVENIKPYLFPLSSMTKEQKKEISKRYNLHTPYGLCIEITNHSEGYWDTDTSCDLRDYLWLIDYFYKNHIDFRGLIELGLAKDATGLNIY